MKAFLRGKFIVLNANVLKNMETSQNINFTSHLKVLARNNHTQKE